MIVTGWSLNDVTEDHVPLYERAYRTRSSRRQPPAHGSFADSDGRRATFCGSAVELTPSQPRPTGWPPPTSISNPKVQRTGIDHPSVDNSLPPDLDQRLWEDLERDAMVSRMSAIASFHILPKQHLPQLLQQPYQTTLEFGREPDDDYGWSGYCVVHVLTYLSDRGVDLFDTPHKAEADHLNSDCFTLLLTAEHQHYLEQLDPADHDEASLV